MGSTQTESKTRRVGNLPTDAQLGTLATLADGLGVEAPTPETADEATEIIGKLQAAYEERSEEPPTTDTPAEGDDGTPAEEDDGTAQPPPDNALSEKDAQKLFDRAVGEFGKALRAVFGVDQLEPSQTPGVVGFLLPGVTEKLPHPDFTRCTTCNGYGNVLTGSMKAGDDERPCPDTRCAGRGYWQKAGAPEPVAPTLVAMPQAATNGSSEWGEAPKWLGDPNLSGGGV